MEKLELSFSRNEILTSSTMNKIVGKINEVIEDGGGASGGGMVITTYNELKTLRDNAELSPGTWYRITDYQCTTTQENTRSAGHRFDIFVLALDESTLSEEARACKHDGDTYFDGCNLEAWKIWYSLDNDYNRFAWADEENGKGVIYRMIDECDNDCPYDFKNIQYLRSYMEDEELDISGYYGLEEDDDNIWAYTFCGFDDDDEVYDSSLKRNLIDTELYVSYGNVVKTLYWWNESYFELPNNVFYRCIEVNLDSDSYDSTFDNCYVNGLFGRCVMVDAFHVKGYFNSCTFSDCDNVIGLRVEHFNLVGCYDLKFGNSCNNITLVGVYSSTFGNNCSYIEMFYSNRLSFENGVSFIYASYLINSSFDNRVSNLTISSVDSLYGGNEINNLHVYSGNYGGNTEYFGTNNDVKFLYKDSYYWRQSGSTGSGPQ